MNSRIVIRCSTNTQNATINCKDNKSSLADDDHL